jgi:competence protein ComEC
MSKSKFFLFFSLTFIGGLALQSWLEIPFLTYYIIFLCGLIISILGWSNPTLRLCGLGLIFLFLGILRFDLNIPKVDKEKIQFYNGTKLAFVGKISEEPDIRIDHTKLVIVSQQFIDGRKVRGKVLVKTTLYPEYQYGDLLEIICHLKRPQEINSFDWPGYLRGKNIYSVCYWPEIRLIKSNQGNLIYQKIFILKKKLKSIINSSLPAKEAGLFSALALGVRGEINPQLKRSFQKTGLGHIIAISGLHITLISGILTSLILFLIFDRKKAFILSFLILSLFIILIGAKASAIRAGIMGFLGGIAPYLGRRKSSLNALAFSVLLMLLFSPQILRYDLGFQLSFLAVLGIIYIVPLLKELFPFLKGKKDFLNLKTIIPMTIAAQIMTFPWIAYKLKILSLISLLANILVIPIVPFLIPLGLISALIGLFWLSLAQILFQPTWLLLAYILKITEILSSLPWASLSFKNIPLVIVLIIYGGICWGIWFLRRKFYQKYVQSNT